MPSLQKYMFFVTVKYAFGAFLEARLTPASPDIVMISTKSVDNVVFGPGLVRA